MVTRARPCRKFTWLRSLNRAKRILLKGRLPKRKTAKNLNWKRRKRRLRPCWTRKLVGMARSMPARKFELLLRPLVIPSERSGPALDTVVRATSDKVEIEDAGGVVEVATVAAPRLRGRSSPTFSKKDR